MSETPEQAAALDAIEAQVNALTEEQQEALSAYLQAHHEAPNTAEEAVALIPAVQAAIEHIAPKAAVVVPTRPVHQTVGASLPLQPLAR